MKKNKHVKPGPKRDRLLKYLWEIVTEKGWKALTERKIERIRILYEVQECVLTEALNDTYKKYIRSSYSKKSHATA